MKSEQGSILERLAASQFIYWCKVLEPLGILVATVALVISVATIVNEFSDRRQERIFRAVSLLGASTGGSAGKPEALSYLISNGVSLDGLKLGDSDRLAAPHFRKFSLANLNLAGANLENATFAEGNFFKTRFAASNATGISLGGTFGETQIWMSDFSRSYIELKRTGDLEIISSQIDHATISYEILTKENILFDETNFEIADNRLEASTGSGIIVEMSDISARCAWITVPFRNIVASDINISGARFGYSQEFDFIDSGASQFREGDKIQFSAWFYEDNPPVNFPEGIPVSVRNRDAVMEQCRIHEPRAFLSNPYGTLQGADGVSPHCISLVRNPAPCQNEKHYTGDPARTQEIDESDPFNNSDRWSGMQTNYDSISDFERRDRSTKDQ